MSNNSGPQKAATNPLRIKAREALMIHGLSLDDACGETEVPACCSDGCLTEPDGHCEHGFPSVLIVAGLI